MDFLRSIDLQRLDAELEALALEPDDEGEEGLSPEGNHPGEGEQRDVD